MKEDWDYYYVGSISSIHCGTEIVDIDIKLPGKILNFTEVSSEQVVIVTEGSYPDSYVCSRTEVIKDSIHRVLKSLERFDFKLGKFRESLCEWYENTLLGYSRNTSYCHSLDEKFIMWMQELESARDYLNLEVDKYASV